MIICIGHLNNYLVKSITLNKQPIPSLYMARINIPIILLSIVMILWGCTTNTVTNNKLQEIRYTEMKFYDPVFIAKEKGFFEEEGINIVFTGELYGGPSMIQAISSGSADAGTTSIVALINARRGGFKVTGVTDVQTSYEEEPIHKWLVLDESGIKKPVDLIGKRIAVNALGSSFYYTTLEYLRQHNLSENQVEFLILPHPLMEEALLNKQVDVAGMVLPFTNHALIKESEKVRVLFSTIDVFEPGTQSVVGIFSDKFIEENPGAIKKFIKAYNKAINFTYNHPDEAKEIFARVLGVEARYITNQKYQPDARIDISSAQKWIGLMEKRGDIKENLIRSEDIVTNEFNLFVVS